MEQFACRLAKQNFQTWGNSCFSIKHPCMLLLGLATIAVPIAAIHFSLSVQFPFALRGSAWTESRDLVATETLHCSCCSPDKEQGTLLPAASTAGIITTLKSLRKTTGSSRGTGPCCTNKASKEGTKAYTGSWMPKMGFASCSYFFPFVSDCRNTLFTLL